MFAPLNVNKLRLSTPTWRSLLLLTLSETMLLSLAVACANVYGGCIYKCIAMAHRNVFVQPNQFDPEGEAPEEVQTLRLQQDVSEWLVCLNNVSLFYVLLQLLPCS